MDFDELVDELGGEHVLDPEAGHRGLDPEGDQQVRYAGAGVADQAERQARFDPLAGGEGVDRRGVNVRVGLEIELAERLVAWEPGSLDPVDLVVH